MDDEEDMVRWKEMGVAGCAGAAKYPIFDAVLTDLEPDKLAKLRAPELLSKALALAERVAERVDMKKASMGWFLRFPGC